MALQAKKVQVAGDSESMSVGRDGPSFTQVYDWVALSGVSPHAFRVYYDLVSYFNEARGAAFPGKERLAVLLNVANGDSVTPYLRELEEVGAIEIKKVGMPARNHYVVHKFPPPGYTGPLNKSEWVALHRSVLEFRNAAAQAKSNLNRKRRHLYLNKTLPETLPAWLLADYGGMPTAEQWAEDHRLEVERRRTEETKRAEAKAKKAAGVPKRPAKVQVSAVPGKIAEQATGPADGSPVPRNITEHVPGDSTGHVPGYSRGDVYLGEVDLGEVKPPLPSRPTTAAAKRSRAAQDRGVESSNEPTPKPGELRRAAQEDLLVAELRTIMEAKPASKRWVEAKTRDTLVQLRGRYDFPVIRLALLHLANGTFGFTGSPARALVEAGPWWATALTEYRTSPEYYMPAQRGPVAECDQCDDHGWLLTDDPIGPAARCTHAAMATVV